VPDGVVYEGYRNRLKQTEYMDGIRVTRVWTFLAANKGTGRRILNYLSYMIMAAAAGLSAKRPDIVIATSPQFFCGWAGAILAKARRLPFVLEIRDIWPESIAAVGAMKKGRLYRLLEWLELKMYAAADHIIAVGEGYRQQLIGRGVQAEDISVVPNGVDLDRFNPCEKDTALKEQLGLNGHFICSYIGTVGMASGLEVVLQAGQILQKRGRMDIVFVIVGDGASRLELEALVKAMGLQNVLVTGRRSREEIPRYFSISDACLVHLRKTPLFETVLPSKIFEAAGMAKPIVIGVPGFAERLVLDAGAGIAIEPENADQLADAVSRLHDDPGLGVQMGNAGRAYVTAHFNRDDLAKDYLAVLGKMVPSTKAVRPAEQVSWTRV
jgi:glycosyltransferase involved in cell wall biosynthesis